MKSPFPGMDPYLESHWGDVHISLITYARDQIRAQLPSDLKVRAEEHVAVQLPDEASHGFYPDVHVIERPSSKTASATSPSAVAVAEPLIVPIHWEQETQRSIQILDGHSGNRIVTTIEILSPANKSSAATAETFQEKQRKLLEGGVNLVEIDLLREGRFILAAPADCVPATYRRPYRICVVRGHRPDRAEIYRVPLQQRLPAIRIPLRPTDDDVRLDLQAILDQAYENGGYEDIDYRLDPLPPLTGDDATWATALLTECKKR